MVGVRCCQRLTSQRHRSLHIEKIVVTLYLLYIWSLLVNPVSELMIRQSGASNRGIARPATISYCLTTVIFSKARTIERADSCYIEFARNYKEQKFTLVVMNAYNVHDWWKFCCFPLTLRNSSLQIYLETNHSRELKFLAIWLVAWLINRGEFLKVKG